MGGGEKSLGIPVKQKRKLNFSTRRGWGLNRGLDGAWGGQLGGRVRIPEPCFRKARLDQKKVRFSMSDAKLSRATGLASLEDFTAKRVAQRPKKISLLKVAGGAEPSTPCQ